MEIPEALSDLAKTIVWDFVDDAKRWTQATDAIARAILAERERCARIAEGFVVVTVEFDKIRLDRGEFEISIGTAANIALAIRRPTGE